MAQFEEASPICRGKNLSWETILLFYNNMPREPMPKSQFNSYTEARINGWTQTHSQIARQLAFYYEENGICYPRFTKEMSFVDLFKYMQNWAAKYFIPNPYAPSLKGQTPTSIYGFILEAINLGKTNFDEILDSIFGITLSSHDKVRVYLNNFTDLIINGNSVSLNTRTIGIESSLYPDEACAIDTKRYYDYFETDIATASNKQRSIGNSLCLQKIYFGTPGSGKSWTIKQKYEQDETKVFRTTFHPDTDYASFVGCYKPVKDEDDDNKIVYEFVPQAFTDAYVAAWSDLDNPYYLIIEEINRGNCAQIFGDLFQLLDRNKDGYSEYPIKADHDLRDYLEENLPEDSEGIKDGKLCLPPNLSIIASMNTSDQSLFPMDSAFKRRWSWEYVPIDYENAESGSFMMTIGGESYNWHDFLKAANKKIKKVTSSEDKQMGNFFIKSSIDEKEFCDKVMFYLWSEVGKDNYQTNDAIFKYYAEEDKLKEFSFNELYDQKKRTTILKGFIRYIEEEEK